MPDGMCQMEHREQTFPSETTKKWTKYMMQQEAMYCTSGTQSDPQRWGTNGEVSATI